MTRVMTGTAREVLDDDDLALCGGLSVRARPFEAFDQDRMRALSYRGALRLWLDEDERGFVSLGGTSELSRVIRVAVAPGQRRKGVGTALFRRAVAELPAGCQVISQVGRHDPDGFAAAMGLAKQDSSPDECTYGITLKPVRRVRVPSGTRIRSLRRFDRERLDDLLAGAGEALPYDDDLHDEDVPLLSSLSEELSFVALRGEQPVGITLVRRDGVLPHVLMTYVPARERRRGLARALKTASLNAMTNAGHTHAFTDCATDNVAIRQLNESLGFVDTTLEMWTKP
ncbi:MAG: family N-acetyltransferase [Frankiales bacterium]|nr:family N-acetyltransferase [Frankiales bacterium]